MHITKKLRINQTPQEAKLWRILKNSNLNNLKFRRQFKIDAYIVDFCCLEKKLIIEIDGGQHNFPENQVMEAKRQKHLEQQGYTVLRFWNNEIDQNLDGVVERILAEL